MELQDVSLVGELLISMFTDNERIIAMSDVIVSAVLLLGLFILQGVGLYTMASRLGMKKKALAFVPFANIYYMGKLAGECKFFGHKLNRAWLFALIFQTISTLYYFCYFAAKFYLYYEHGTPTYPEADPTLTTGAMGMFVGKPDWGELRGFSEVVYKFYVNSSAVMLILDLFTKIFMAVLVCGLYKKYSPRNYFMMTMLTIFLPVIRLIFVFAIRNNTPMDYEEYVRRQREAYIRRQQQYQNTYGNPYGNPYGNRYGNPYGRPTPPPQQPQKPEEPFGEFDEGEPFEELSGKQPDNQDKGNSDGFFD